MKDKLKNIEAYQVEAVAAEELKEQEIKLAALRQSLGKPDIEAAKRVLAEREQVEPESDLDSQVVETLRSKLR